MKKWLAIIVIALIIAGFAYSDITRFITVTIIIIAFAAYIVLVSNHVIKFKGSPTDDPCGNSNINQHYWE